MYKIVFIEWTRLKLADQRRYSFMRQSSLAWREKMSEQFEHRPSYQLPLSGHFAIEILYFDCWVELFPSELERRKSIEWQQSESLPLVFVALVQHVWWIHHDYSTEKEKSNARQS